MNRSYRMGSSRPGAGHQRPSSGATSAAVALPVEQQRKFAPRLSADFSRVRIHHDAVAAAQAAALGANAFTIGSEIFFAANRYQPDTAAGAQLLAHELTHVAQQSRGGAASSASVETRADAAAARVGRGESVSIVEQGNASTGLYCDDDEKKRAGDATTATPAPAVQLPPSAAFQLPRTSLLPRVQPSSQLPQSSAFQLPRLSLLPTKGVDGSTGIGSPGAALPPLIPDLPPSSDFQLPKTSLLPTATPGSLLPPSTDFQLPRTSLLPMKGAGQTAQALPAPNLPSLVPTLPPSYFSGTGGPLAPFTTPLLPPLGTPPTSLSGFNNEDALALFAAHGVAPNQLGFDITGDYARAYQQFSDLPPLAQKWSANHFLSGAYGAELGRDYPNIFDRSNRDFAAAYPDEFHTPIIPLISPDTLPYIWKGLQYGGQGLGYAGRGVGTGLNFVGGGISSGVDYLGGLIAQWIYGKKK